MSKHAHRDEPDRSTVVAASVFAVLLLLVPVAMLAMNKPWQSTAAQVAPTSSTVSTPGAAPPVLAGAPQAQRTERGQKLKSVANGSHQKVLESGSALRRKTQGLARRRAVGPTAFRVSTLNLLGDSHTAKGGNRPGWASGSTRMGWAVQLLTGAGVQVAGLQELQSPQLAVLQRQLPSWGVYPGASLGRAAMADSITWSGAVWTLVQAHTIDVPYFRGARVPMPYVQLQHTGTGQLVWFANFHNPADAHGPAQRFRDEARAIETNLVNELMSDGTPVILTGDMNDREEYFCPLTAASTMHAANGGSTGSGCAPPDQMDVDWIFGDGSITFPSFHRVTDGLVRRTTDHPFVWADALVSPGA